MDIRTNVLRRIQDLNEPMGVRVFERLGLTYEHKRWKDHDLFWAEGGDEAFANALREWHWSHEMCPDILCAALRRLWSAKGRALRTPLVGLSGASRRAAVV